MAKRAFVERKNDEGRAMVLDIVAANDSRQMAQLLACKLLLTYGCYEDAVALAIHRLDIGDVHPHFYDYAAKAYASLGHFGRAEQIYDEMSGRYPDRIAPKRG